MAAADVFARVQHRGTKTSTSGNSIGAEPLYPSRTASWDEPHVTTVTLPTAFLTAVGTRDSTLLDSVWLGSSFSKRKQKGGQAKTN
eukprot:SAG22_NODE_444_length_10453_cov_8.586343_11_plen_86_part_00